MAFRYLLCIAVVIPLAPGCGDDVRGCDGDGGGLSDCLGTLDGAITQSDGGEPPVDGGADPDGGDGPRSDASDQRRDGGDGPDATADSGPPEPCGDGELVDGERCDDGNRRSGDGCDERCRIEPEHYCVGQSGGSRCAPCGPLRVDPASPERAGDGRSWATAMRELQAALDITRVMTEPDQCGAAEVWLAAGHHYPGPPGDREASFVLHDGLAIYGGFAGNEQQRDERDPVEHESVLSGDLNRDDAWETGAASDNTYHVVSADGLGDSVLLDGLTVADGNADGLYPHYNGGGLWVQFGELSLHNVTLRNNQALRDGGGLYALNASIELEGLAAHDNVAGRGGALTSEESSLAILESMFARNTAEDGGGLFAHGSMLTLTSVTFEDNMASRDGGALGQSDGQLMLEGGTFRANSAGARGGALFQTDGARAELELVTLDGNEAGTSGGGFFQVASQLSLDNFSSVNAAAAGDGGGIASVTSEATIRLGSFASGTAARGAGIFVDRGSMTITRCDLQQNQASVAGGGLFAAGARIGYARGSVVNNRAVETGAGVSADAAELDLHSVALTNNFVSADGTARGGGLYATAGATRLVNASFMGNGSAGTGPAVTLAAAATLALTNATMATGQTGEGRDGDELVTVHNSVLDAVPGGVSEAVVAHSCVRSGSYDEEDPEETNRDDCGDGGEGTSTVDNGAQEHLPDDMLDVDADGDTDEPLPLDLAGEPRVAGDAVDMGAYEY